ncbi:MAG: DUF4855 domain-containing protein [Syntrophomonadaceae bacterium]
MSRYKPYLSCDIAPRQGRDALAGKQGIIPPEELQWMETDFSLGIDLLGLEAGDDFSVKLKARLDANGSDPQPSGWIELSASSHPHGIVDMILLGTRPMPKDDLTCISRHPCSRDYLLAGSEDGCLLTLDARMPADLHILEEITLPVALRSLVCCGTDLLGLSANSSQLVQIKHLPGSPGAVDVPIVNTQELPLPLVALAENDAHSAWGLSAAGEIFQISISDQHRHAYSAGSGDGDCRRVCRLQKGGFTSFNLEGWLRSTYRAVASGRFRWKSLLPQAGNLGGLAFDGRHFFSCVFRRNDGSGDVLRIYDQKGQLKKIFPTWPEAGANALSYCHAGLLVLDRRHQQLHLYHLADNLEPLASTRPGKHPGYLPAGSDRSGGIHNLCLLYVGGDRDRAIHRYDVTGLRPMVGWVDTEGNWLDSFMDGFLILAQYSPLQNGRAFSPDLAGAPARKEDWLALFEEYFAAGANLDALNSCAGQIKESPVIENFRPIKVVLGIPCPDPRCREWDQNGHGLSGAEQRIEATRWAMCELMVRWAEKRYEHLCLAGFYYMSEQGVWNDPLLRQFPQLCYEHGLRSFAIPGITSAWMSEFSRAGFDCVALQSSHAFWQPFNRPRHFALKSAGLIAREFGMGMEVELPYNVTEQAGGDKLRDYLNMARIQGWARAFKAYFQSYRLIRDLAESPVPEVRSLYDDLYCLSREAGPLNQETRQGNGPELELEWSGQFAPGSQGLVGRFSCEASQGNFSVTGLSVK